jgi:hypothetical protein
MALKRLASTWALALFPGLGSAFVFALLTLVIAGPLSEFGDDLALLVTSLTHGLFVALLADGVQRKSADIRAPAIGAGVLLGLLIWGFAQLDHWGTSYQCADGVLFYRSNVPMLPWLWIGWFFLALFAIPSRLLGWRGSRLEPWTDRAAMCFPFALLIVLLGVPFQTHRIDCTGPFVGYGLFEGGLIAGPLLGLFLFSMAFSLAVLSAAYVRPQPESD